jgi:protein-tyrosine phosphatase
VPEQFSVLVVCTANVCRSPLAEGIIQAAFANAAQEHRVDEHLVVVRSAGTDAEPGDPMCPLSAARIHAVPQQHRSRLVTADLLAGADLVVTAERYHRGACARTWPACRPYLFTLRQAAALAGPIADRLAAGELPEGAPALPDGQDERLRWLASEMDAARGSLAGMPDGFDDIADSHGAPDPDHEPTMRQVEDAAGTLARAMLGVVAVAVPDQR